MFKVGPLLNVSELKSFWLCDGTRSHVLLCFGVSWGISRDGTLCSQFVLSALCVAVYLYTGNCSRWKASSHLAGYRFFFMELQLYTLIEHMSFVFYTEGWWWDTGQKAEWKPFKYIVMCLVTVNEFWIDKRPLPSPAPGTHALPQGHVPVHTGQGPWACLHPAHGLGPAHALCSAPLGWRPCPCQCCTPLLRQAPWGLLPLTSVCTQRPSTAPPPPAHAHTHIL
jgi:hypothetical protein